uniref:Large ribosomal subunit protein bL21m n=1 Tax=Balbiania investiens TaxID=111861 RepID=A0A4D6BM47_9FLOR|nr:ribosomal protein L21 [Balbiania investiens]QBX88537.1 ribosomal protein L21 [Balbiania investiens]
MIYAIIEVSGKQVWMQPGRFYDLNKIAAKSGEVIKLEKILFIRNNVETIIGDPCIQDASVKGRVLRHLRGRKITIFKMKPKKNQRSKNGHRQELSRVLVESIQLKGLKV